jgi:ribonuclease T1
MIGAMRKHFASLSLIALRAMLILSGAVLVLATWSCGHGSETSSQNVASSPVTTSDVLPAGKGLEAANKIRSTDLPPEARQTIQLVKKGGLFPYAKDGSVFSNREGLLAAKPSGYYREYTVKTPGERDRGARRIIVGKDGEYYYTDDHYRSFKRIQE